MKIRDAKTCDLEAIVQLWHEMMILHSQYNQIYKMKDNAEKLYRSYAQSLISDDTKKMLLVEEKASLWPFWQGSF